MTNKQVWVTIVLTFVLLLVVTAGSLARGMTASIENILSSPAATSSLDIDADIIVEMSEGGELELKYIHLNRIRGEVSSKILDLILLAVNN